MLDTLPEHPRRSSLPARSFVQTAFAIWYQLHLLIRESVKFATVGSVGFVVDVAVFNALLYGGLMHDKPLTAKTASVIVATLVTYTGNRHWTFRQRTRTTFGRAYPVFFLLNGIGLGLALACLATSRYVLGFSGPLADNIAANVVGLGLGTLFRFWSYRKWVFPAQSGEFFASPGPRQQTSGLSSLTSR